MRRPRFPGDLISEESELDIPAKLPIDVDLLDLEAELLRPPLLSVNVDVLGSINRISDTSLRVSPSFVLIAFTNACS